MKRIYIFMVLILFILNFSTFSRVSSQVRITVKDMDSGLPIKGVHIFLSGVEKDEYHPCVIDPRYEYSEKVDKTDGNGEFVFKDEWSGEKYIYCVKEGYVSFNPCYLENEKDPEYGLKTFRINEGEIKVVVVKMKKGGGGLRVLLKKKDESGISLITDYLLYVDKYSKSIDPKTGKKYLYPVFDQPIQKFIYPKGYIDLKGFEAGEEFVIRVEKEGLPTRTKNFVVKEGKISDVTFLYDYTSKTALKIIVNYEEGSGVRINLFNELSDDITSLWIAKKNSTRIIPDLISGKYSIHAAVSIPFIKEKIIKKISVYVKKDEITFVTINFK